MFFFKSLSSVSLTLSLVLVLALVCPAVVAMLEMPEQIHLAFGRTPDVMAVQWATMDTFCLAGTVVQYGLRADELTESVKGSCFPFDLEDQLQQSNHVAYMTGLRASTRYFYQVGGDYEENDETVWSEIFHFKTAPDANTLQSALPQKFLVYGDLGSGASQPEATSTIMPWASAEIQEDHFDMILHVGDFAYDFDSNNGATGRQFMNEISNMSAFVPYMVDHGNHEVSFDFAHYTEFFRNQPSNTSPRDLTVTSDNGVAPNNWYFSWNVGLVHFVTVSSEIYFHHPELIAAQWEWLKVDLALANQNRTNAPWIVVHAHRGLYCSCDDDCNTPATKMRAGIPVPSPKNDEWGFKYGIEELLYDYGVDLWLNGHEHNYERMYDIEPRETYTYLSGSTQQNTVNPIGPVYIVTGDAGNRENHEEFKYPQPDRTAFRTSSFGYSRMSVHNATHLFWDQVECDLSADPPVEGQVIDSFWLVQENHGPFSDVPYRNRVMGIKHD